MADWDDNCPNCFGLTGYSAQAASGRRRRLVCTCAFGNDTGAAIREPLVEVERGANPKTNWPRIAA